MAIAECKKLCVEHDVDDALTCDVFQDSLCSSKEQSDCLLATVLEKKAKIDALVLEVQVTSHSFVRSSADLTLLNVRSTLRLIFPLLSL